MAAKWGRQHPLRVLPVFLSSAFSVLFPSSSLLPSSSLAVFSCFPLCLSTLKPLKFIFSRWVFGEDEYMCCFLRIPSVFAGSPSNLSFIFYGLRFLPKWLFYPRTQHFSHFIQHFIVYCLWHPKQREGLNSPKLSFIIGNALKHMMEK